MCCELWGASYEEWAPRESGQCSRDAASYRGEPDQPSSIPIPFLIYDPFEHCHRENIPRVLETSARPHLASFQTIAENTTLYDPDDESLHHIDIIFLSPTVRLSPSLIFTALKVDVIRHLGSPFCAVTASMLWYCNGTQDSSMAPYQSLLYFTMTRRTTPVKTASASTMGNAPSSFLHIVSSSAFYPP